MRMNCRFCGSVFILAWQGRTPQGYPLSVYICPSCFSTRFEGSESDPTFRMLCEIEEAFMRVWSKEEK